MWYFSPKRLFSVIVLLALFGASVRVAQDPDLFWHLKAGETILQNGLLYEDPGFTYTATDREWVTHEWLIEVIMFWIYKNLGGFWGLSLFFAGLVTIAFGLLFWASDGRPYLAGEATLWGMLASLPFINSRPQMVNILFGAIIILVVEQVRRGRLSTRWFWSFPLIFLLWVNMHGGFLLGFVIMGVYGVGEGLQLLTTGEREDGLSWSQIFTLAGSGVVGIVFSNINPNTTRMWVYAFETLSSEAMREIIAEWRSPNFHLSIFWLFGFMLMATFFIMIYSKRQVLWTDALFVAGTMFASLQSIRNIPLFALVAIPVMSRHLLGLFEASSWYDLLSGEEAGGSHNRTMHWLNWGATIALLIVLAVYSIDVLQATDTKVSEQFPAAAVDWLEAQGLTDAKIFNHYGWGGYLIWREVPVFIDGRADLYGDEFMYVYFDTINLKPHWKEPFETYDIDYVLIETDSALAVALDEIPNWEIIYKDEMATIFGRS